MLGVRCMFDWLATSDFGDKWPLNLVKIFENVFQDSSTRHRIMFRCQIWWKSAVTKLPKGHRDYHTQKRELRGTYSSPLKIPVIITMYLPNLMCMSQPFVTLDWIGQDNFGLRSVVVLLIMSESCAFQQTSNCIDIKIYYKKQLDHNTYIINKGWHLSIYIFNSFYMWELSRYARTILSRFVADRLFQIPLPRVQVSFNAIRYY